MEEVDFRKSLSPRATKLPSNPDTFSWRSSDFCAWLCALFEKALDASQHGCIHRRGQQPRLRILLARMVNTEKMHSRLRKLHLRTVRKAVFRPGRNHATMLQYSQEDIPSDFSEGEHGLGLQNVDLAFQIRATIQHFRRERLVIRRSASCRRRDVDILQLQSVIRAHGGRLICKARIIQRLIQENSRAIPGEHSSRAIGAVRTRR